MTNQAEENTGRFSAAALQARSRIPQDVSRREGVLLLTYAIVSGAFQAVIYQANSWEWGGIIRFAALALLLAAAIWLGGRRARAQRVHPRGHHRRFTAAVAFMVLVVLVAGWFWIVPAEGHGASWVATTLVAAVSVLPLAGISLHLIIRGTE